MATFQEVADSIKTKIASAKNFKIGKTGQSVKERFDQEHCKNYNHYASMGTSTDAKVIDELELFLIKEFIGYKNNDNDQHGGGEMTKSSTYSIYLCWN